MKKLTNLTKVLLTIALLLMVTASCGKSTIQSNTTAQVTQPGTSEPDTVPSTAEKVFEPWNDAYASFLREFPVSAFYDYSTFFLRDLDNNGVPELSILQRKNEGQIKILSVYSYDAHEDGVVKISERDDPNSFAGAFRISNNPRFPGLFSCSWGGGVERFGYLSVKDKTLEFEIVWIYDHSIDTFMNIDASPNKELIKESMDAFPPYEYSGNLIVEHNIKEDDILEVFGN